MSALPVGSDGKGDDHTGANAESRRRFGPDWTAIRSTGPDDRVDEAR
jgi:hypothetical protein